MKKNTRTFGFQRLAAIVSILTGLCALLAPSVLATQTLVISTMSLPGGPGDSVFKPQCLLADYQEQHELEPLES
jgi:hypothetical protein